MKSQEFLSGKAKIYSLACIDQPAARTETRARLVTPGGELAVLADGRIPILHLAYLELREGKVRGNHFHKLRHEYFYLISGEVELYLKDLASGEQVNVTLRPGDLFVVEPEIVHSYVPKTSG